MRFVSRGEWGARSPKTVTFLQAAQVTIHWEGPHMGVFSHATCAGRV